MRLFASLFAASLLLSACSNGGSQAIPNSGSTAAAAIGQTAALHPAAGSGCYAEQRSRPLQSAATWLQTGWDATHTDLQPDETLLNTSNVPCLLLSWTYTPNIPIPPVVVSSKGILYEVAADNLYALNASTGALIWSDSTGSTDVTEDGMANPALYDNYIYVETFRTCGAPNAAICAINASTGKFVWSYAPGPSDQYEIESGITVAKGRVFFTTNQWPPSGTGGTIVALPAMTGKHPWQLSKTAFAYPAPGPPAVDGNTVYFGTASGVCAVKIGSTKPKWCTSERSDGCSCSEAAVAISGSTVFAAYSAGLVALNAKNGKVLWNNLYGGGGEGSRPAIDSTNGLVFATVGGYLYAFNMNNGATIWSYSGGAPSEPYGTPSVANGVVYVQCLGAIFCALNEQTGALLWNDVVAGESKTTYANPVVDDGYVYTNCDAGQACTNIGLGAWTVPLADSRR